MILVAVGASQFPFDRLLRAVDGLADAALEPVLVQHGPSLVRPAGADCVAFLPLPELAERVRKARAVVTHAGVGSILLALNNGKRPYVVPRLSAFGETVDDHQLESARRFARAGLVTLVEDPATVAEALSREPEAAVGRPDTELALVRELRDYIDAATT